MPFSTDDILAALSIGENSDWEFKSARGGTPASLWETYSAMANTDGGVIVLGVQEKDGLFQLSGLSDPGKTRKEIWDLLNNRGKVSRNLLTESDVQVKTVHDTSIITLQIPRATRKQRPVYIGHNPLTNTYRRNYEGDYKCTEDEVKRMLADQSDEPVDSQILPYVGFDELDSDSLKRFRNRFLSRDPDHPWLNEDMLGFLAKLGGWRKDRLNGQEGVTLAGLLMFGRDEVIRDPAILPSYQLDYREKPQEEDGIRWLDRFTLDGKWSGNVFEFFERVMRKLTQDLKLPFQLTPDLFRKDETPVHEAIREALVNALIHADYRGPGGVIIEKHPDRLEMSNPGTLLLSFEQILKGGVSECRNKSLQLMFQMIGGGEKAGSGIDKIRQGWNSQHWRSPRISEHIQPDRVFLTLPMVSLLPDFAVDNLKQRFGSSFSELPQDEVQALVTAEIEGKVTNARMQEIVNKHPADITRMLQYLARQGFLVADGVKRGKWYKLPPLSPRDSLHSGETPYITGEGSIHLGKDSLHLQEEDKARPPLSEEKEQELRDIAAKAGRRSSVEEMRGLILKLCKNEYLSSAQLADFLDRNQTGLLNRYIKPMVNEGMLELLYPQKPNRPDQAYKTKRHAE